MKWDKTQSLLFGKYINVTFLIVHWKVELPDLNSFAELGNGSSRLRWSGSVLVTPTSIEPDQEFTFLSSLTYRKDYIIRFGSWKRISLN